MENENFPSSVEEGWIRPHFIHMAVSSCGDGVVERISCHLLALIHQAYRGTPLYLGEETFEAFGKLNNSRK